MPPIKIKKETISKQYIEVLVPGTYRLTVSNVNRIFDQALGTTKDIVNFKAIAEHNVQKVIDLFKDEAEIEINKLNGLTMSGNIIINDESNPPATPIKGEVVKVVVDYRLSRTKEDILVVTSIGVEKPVQASLFNFEPSRPETVKMIKVTEEDVEPAIVSKQDEIAIALSNPSQDF